MANQYNSLSHTKWLCKYHGSKGPRRQHLLFVENSRKSKIVHSSMGHFSAYTDPFTKIGTLQKQKRLFAKNI